MLIENGCGKIWHFSPSRSMKVVVFPEKKGQTLPNKQIGLEWPTIELRIISSAKDCTSIAVYI